MDTIELERLERIARNMPVGRLAMHRCKAKRGEIFLAYGEAGDGAVHGVWGYCGIARPMEFKPGTKVEAVRQVLADDAHNFIEQLYG